MIEWLPGARGLEKQLVRLVEVVEAYLNTPRRLETSKCDWLRMRIGRERAGVGYGDVLSAAVTSVMERAPVTGAMLQQRPEAISSCRRRVIARPMPSRGSLRAGKPDCSSSSIVSARKRSRRLWRSKVSPRQSPTPHEAARHRSATSLCRQRSHAERLGALVLVRRRSRTGAAARRRSDQPLQSRQQARDDLRISFLHLR
jgi:hypothetical protein